MLEEKFKQLSPQRKKAIAEIVELIAESRWLSRDIVAGRARPN